MIVSRERIGRKDALRILRIFLRGLFRAGEMRYNVKNTCKAVMVCRKKCWAF